jgi:hypothetical protein
LVSVTQTLPSGPSAMLNGPLAAVATGNSFIQVVLTGQDRPCVPGRRGGERVPWVFLRSTRGPSKYSRTPSVSADRRLLLADAGYDAIDQWLLKLANGGPGHRIPSKPTDWRAWFVNVSLKSVDRRMPLGGFENWLVGGADQRGHPAPNSGPPCRERRKRPNRSESALRDPAPAAPVAANASKMEQGRSSII